MMSPHPPIRSLQHNGLRSRMLLEAVQHVPLNSFFNKTDKSSRVRLRRTAMEANRPMKPYHLSFSSLSLPP